MCNIRRTKKGNKNVRVVKALWNSESGILVELTRKTMISGQIGYFVVVTNTANGQHLRISRPVGIKEAYGSFMRCSGLDLQYGFH